MLTEIKGKTMAIKKHSFEHLLNVIYIVGTCPPTKKIPVIDD